MSEPKQQDKPSVEHQITTIMNHIKDIWRVLDKMDRRDDRIEKSVNEVRCGQNVNNGIE